MALYVNHLCKRYENFQLKDVSFHLPKGYIMGFVGKNGAGKTTTIKSIFNATAFEGDISVLGMDNRSQAYMVKQKIGFVLDQPCFPENFNLKQIETYVGNFYESWDSKRYHELLEQFGLAKVKRVRELSRGMGMKLQLAVALSHHAKLLILDEPTSGLDPVARDELLDILMGYIKDEENSILFSSHISSDLEKIADYITVIRRGEIFYSGEKETLLKSYRMIKGDWRRVTPELSKEFIGMRRYDDSFEAMVSVDQLPEDGGFHVEEISLDEILIYIERGQNDENDM